MTFHHLPRDWALRPVTDADIFEDVVDLVVPEDARRLGCVYLLLCRRDGRLAQVVGVDRVPSRSRSEAVLTPLGRLLAGAVEHVEDASVVLVAGRRGACAPEARDLRRRQVLVSLAEDAGFEVLGYALATPLGVTALEVTPTCRTA